METVGLQLKRLLTRKSEVVVEVEGSFESPPEFGAPARQIVSVHGGFVPVSYPEERARSIELARGGLSASSIAAEVGRPVGTVKTWLAQARRRGGL